MYGGAGWSQSAAGKRGMGRDHVERSGICVERDRRRLVARRPHRGGSESGVDPFRVKRSGTFRSTTERQGDDPRTGTRLCNGGGMNPVETIGQLRVSVATFNRVVFRHPQNDTLMLALERQATVMEDGALSVQAQPFGGGIHILNRSEERRVGKECRS